MSRGSGTDNCSAAVALQLSRRPFPGQCGGKKEDCGAESRHTARYIDLSRNEFRRGLKNGKLQARPSR
jgi:hypothetical protein